MCWQRLQLDLELLTLYNSWSRLQGILLLMQQFFLGFLLARMTRLNHPEKRRYPCYLQNGTKYMNSMEQMKQLVLAFSHNCSKLVILMEMTCLIVSSVISWNFLSHFVSQLRGLVPGPCLSSLLKHHRTYHFLPLMCMQSLLFWF